MRWDAKRISLLLLATFTLWLTACSGGGNDFPEAPPASTTTSTPTATPPPPPEATAPASTPPPASTGGSGSGSGSSSSGSGGGGGGNNNNDDDDDEEEDDDDDRPNRPNRPHRSFAALVTPPPGAQVVWDTHGQALAIWRAFDGVRNDLWADRFNGVSWTGARLLETNVGDVGNAHIALDATGNAIAAWEQETDGSRAIWAARFEIVRGWQAASVISRAIDGTRMDAFAPQVSANADTSMTVRWQQIDRALVPLATASYSRWWENRFTPGLGWSGATLITTP